MSFDASDSGEAEICDAGSLILVDKDVRLCVCVECKYGSVPSEKKNVPLSGLRGQCEGHAYASSHLQRRPTGRNVSKVSYVVEGQRTSIVRFISPSLSMN